MILAAGRGERLRPLTDHTPKPLIQVRGKALIEWHLEALARAGVRDVVINLSWLGEKIQAALGTGEHWGLRVHYSVEGPVALETGGGIFRALSWLGPEPFLLVNGDIFTDLDYGAIALPARSQAHLVLVPNPPHHLAGDFVLQDGWLAETGKSRFTYSGVGVFSSGLFAGCSEGRFPLLPLFRRAMASRSLSGELFEGFWTDVGTIDRLAQCEDPK
jgi:MurNAc alpha-1-phosphate uridylyltransferase